jgi:hypothetical protein
VRRSRARGRRNTGRALSAQSVIAALNERPVEWSSAEQAALRRLCVAFSPHFDIFSDQEMARLRFARYLAACGAIGR